jgi:inosose dehydratase
MIAPSSTRREFLQMTAMTAAALPLLGLPAFALQENRELLRSPGASSSGKDPWGGLKVGVASYTFHKLPLEQCIDAIKRLDLHYVSIKDSHLPLKSTTEERKAVVQKFKDAKILPISCGVISMSNEANARQAFEYARDIGVPVIVANPAPASVPLLDKLVAEFNIKIAIHNHGPESKEYKSPYDAMEVIKGRDPRIGLCIDVGHTKRAGVDPAEAIRKCKDRLYDVHFKDIAKATGGNVAMEVGRGVLDIRGMLQALLDIGFGGHVGFEFEKAAENPLPGLAESVGFTRGVLSCITAQKSA